MRFKSFAVIIFAILLSGSAFAQERWVGHYTFEENGGKTAGGSAIIVSHDVEIIDTDDGLIAEIKANGFQTSRDLTAKVKIEGQKALFYFESYGEDNILSTFKEGELLFTLERKNNQLLTTWGAYTDVTGKFAKPGKVYFEKLKKVEE